MTDAINAVVPGQPMSEADREALRKSNIEASNEALRLAAEHRARDMAEKGNEKPVLAAVADSVREKLESLPPQTSEGNGTAV